MNPDPTGNRPRLVYLHQYFTTPSMPGGTRSWEFAQRLAQSGFDVHVVTSDRVPGAVQRQELLSGGVAVHWLPVAYSNGMGPRARLGAFMQFAARASWVAWRLQPDVVIASSTPLTIAIPGIAATLGRKTPIVFEVRDLWPQVPLALGALSSPLAARAARWLERQAYRHSTRVIALSPGMRDGVIATGFPAEAVTVVPNAADVHTFRLGPGGGQQFRSTHGWLGERPLVVYAGTLGRVNGIAALADLAAQVRRLDDDVRFVVVGDGAEREQVREHARRLGVLDETFFMLPPQPKDRMPELFAAATVTSSFVIDVPELEANSANKFFDSLAAARPVVINHGGWLADLIEETGAGLVLNRNPAKAAAQLVEALRSPSWTRRAGEAAARLADEQFSRDLLFRAFEATVVAALAEGRRVHQLVPRGRGHACWRARINAD